MIKKISLMAASVVAIASTSAAAQTADASLGTNQANVLITAVVENSCVALATPIDFGVITSVGSQELNKSGALMVTCTPGANYSVSLGDGLNFGNGTRKMLDPVLNNTIPYALRISDAGGTGTLLDTVTGVIGTGLLTTYPLTATIAQGTPSVPAGAYADIVTVTVNY